MKLISCRLRDYKFFDFSGIEDLSVSFINPTQIVLGTNGSGKSSYLRQLGPYPVAKSFFNSSNNALKELVIEHNGQRYILRSDFSEKSHPHSFSIEGSTELNEGGGTSVQADLVEKYFDLNKDKEKLLFGDIDITSMGAAQRKVFLLKSSPLQLGFMIDHQKTLGSKIRGVKFELKSNSERESELLDLLMTPEELESLHKEVKDVDTHLTDLVSKRGGVLERCKASEERINEWKERNKESLQKGEFNNIEKTLEMLKEKESIFLNAHSDFSYDKNRLEELKILLAEKDKDISFENNRLEDICTRLRKIETELDKTDGRQFSDIEQQKVSLEKELTNLRNELKTKGFSLSKMETGYHTIQDNHDLSSILPDLDLCLKPLSYITHRLVSRETFRQDENRLRAYQQELVHLRSTKKGCEKEITTLYEQLKRSEHIESLDPCSKEACPLYRHTMERRQDRKDTLKRLETETQTIDDTIKRLEGECSDLEDQLTDLRPAMEALSGLQKLIERAPALSRYIGADILEKLSNNPSWLYNRISGDVRYSTLKETEQTVLKSLSSLEEKLSNQKSISDVFRKSQLQEKSHLESSFTQYTQKKDKLKSERLLLEKELTTFTTYETLKSDQEKCYKLVEEKDIGKKLKKKKEECDEALHEVNYAISQETSKKGKLDLLLGEQTKLRSQYEGEIKRRKEELLVMQQELNVADESLKALLDDSVRGWLERLISQVNKYIASVFTYRLEVKVPSGPVDFTFRMKAKDTEAHDISTGSTAQKEIINLAFCLALRDEYKMYDYPLFLDETGKTFDSTHQFRIIGLLNSLVQEKFVSQMVLINHHAAIHGGLNNAQTLVLNSENIDLPPNYNEGVVIT